jgi:hypothetical protein
MIYVNVLLTKASNDNINAIGAYNLHNRHQLETVC